MGWGDELIGSGVARQNWERHRMRTAFGDGRYLIWNRRAHEIFRNNPRVIRPGEHVSEEFIWSPHYTGRRLYMAANVPGRFVFADFECPRGEMFFSEDELRFAAKMPSNSIIIEPNTKPSASNKQWPFSRYQQVADELMSRGNSVAQFSHDVSGRLDGVTQIRTWNFRTALAVLARQRLYIGPEGGLHHGAAAVGIPAVVLFGGFISPRQTGYSDHRNLYAGGEPCGSKEACGHCREALGRITAEQVIHEALGVLDERSSRLLSA